MLLCALRQADGASRAAVFVPGRGAVFVSELLGADRGDDLMEYLTPDQLGALTASVRAKAADSFFPLPDAVDAPYRRPRKILGIGLNYRAHAGDLGAQAPRSSPASFLKGDHTIIGPGEHILLPPGVGRVTAEAELALVIGRECFRVGTDEALTYVAGVTAVLDQTAEEVLLENPRYLTRVKNYPTFFSFGPFIMTLDEVRDRVGELRSLEVATVHNGVVRRRDSVANMTFSPAELVSFHSHVMPLYPGDIISTGTPGAVALAPGDEVRCELGTLMTLANPVATGDQ
jgi:2-keto-4-pentenoate hydratase/2-oxohepta-3-ene-1,7-dioic acid hydratase in catechol pathway